MDWWLLLLLLVVADVVLAVVLAEIPSLVPGPYKNMIIKILTLPNKQKCN